MAILFSVLLASIIWYIIGHLVTAFCMWKEGVKPESEDVPMLLGMVVVWPLFLVVESIFFVTELPWNRIGDAYAKSFAPWKKKDE